MSVPKIRSALVQAFIAGAFFDSSKVQWENKQFTPPADAPWASVFFLPNNPSVATLGPDGTDEVDGFLQVDLNYPPDTGTADIDAKYDAMRLVFPAGARFTYSGTEVIIKSCGRSQGRVVGSFYRVSATIMFYSHINR